MIPEIMIFNPRGQSLKNIEDVQLLCGLILRCIDPDGSVQNEMQKLSHDGVTTLNNWRETADRYIKTNPSPNKEPHSLRRFVDAWRTRTKVEGGAWDRHREDVPLVELVYKLVTWIPCMQDDKEGLVYLEAITRTFSQAALFCDFESHIIFDVDHPDLEQASKREAIRKIMMPLALGVIDINEDLLETMPTDRLNIMSIHQAKGLQFPLVIVDVGSEFDTEHPSQRFKRFPEKSDKTCTMEDCLREYSSLGKPERNAIDRSFDDLIRKAFVAYSRPQDVLLLVGLRSVSNGYRISSGIKYIPNVATGWDRKREWIWGPGLHNLIHIERDEHEE
jgi:DNA helicase-2/ATP-dependent DNA helicase PcrA